jgi:hypothetical protein
MKPSEVLAAARDYIAEHGWAQSQYTADDGRVCALMAVRMAALLSRVPAMTSMAALDMLGEVALELTGYCDVVPLYNDQHCRDVTDVFNWLDKARAGLQERGR